jgi:hypothetical protein
MLNVLKGLLWKARRLSASAPSMTLDEVHPMAPIVGSKIPIRMAFTYDTIVEMILALAASGNQTARVVHRPRLLSDNGSSYVSADLAKWLDRTAGIPIQFLARPSVAVAACRPMGDPDPPHRGWWASDEAPSPVILAILAIIGLSGLFAAATAVIDAILKQ